MTTFLGVVASNIPTNGANSITATLTEELPPGTLLIVQCTSQATGSVDGPTDHHQLVDSLGWDYIKLSEVTRRDDSGGFRTGIRQSLWLLDTREVMPVGTVFSMDLPTNTFARGIRAYAWDKDGLSKAAVVVGVSSHHGSGDNPNAALDTGEATEYLWVHLGAGDSGGSMSSSSLPSGWDAPLGPSANGGNAFVGVVYWGQFRTSESADASATLTSATGRRWAMAMIALEITEAIRALPQEIVSDTFYSRPILVDEPNWVVPVRQTLDPALSLAGGDAGVWDAGRVAPGLPSGLALQAHFTLFGREAIGRWRSFLDVVKGRSRSFWCPGWSAVADLSADADAEQPTLLMVPGHPLGAGDWVVMHKHDGTLIASQIDDVTDEGGTVVLTSDLPVAIPRAASRVSRLHLVRLASDDVAMRFHSLEIAELTLTVVAVHPDELTAFDVDAEFGEPEWQDSEQPILPPPPALKRPNVTHGINSIPWLRGGLWVQSAAVANRVIEFVVQENVDALELQCADEFPVGFQADAYEPGSGLPFIWDKQVQEYAPGGGILSGFGTGFVVSVESGPGYMKPCAFRCRTRKVIEGATCYSPWRYWLSLPGEVGENSASTHPDPVTCGRWRWICANGHGDWFHGPVPPGVSDPFNCQAVPDPPEGGWNCQLIESSWGTHDTNPNSWHARFTFQYRTTMLLDFSDRHARILRVGRSAVVQSIVTSFPADTSFVTTDQHPLQLPETPE